LGRRRMGERVEPNDRVYFYMMKYVASCVADVEEKEAKLVELFTGGT